MDEMMDLFSAALSWRSTWAFKTSEARWKRKNIQVVYVEWSPPAGGDQEMIDLLDQLL